jgi:hypothetical protein
MKMNSPFYAFDFGHLALLLLPPLHLHHRHPHRQLPHRPLLRRLLRLCVDHGQTILITSATSNECWLPRHDKGFTL